MAYRRNAQPPPPDDTQFEQYKVDFEAVKEKLNEGEKAKEELKRRNEGAPAPHRSSPEDVFLLLIVVAIGGKLSLYIFAEDWGTKAHTEGMISNVLFGGGALLIFCKWIGEQWRAIKYLLVPKAVTVVVAMVICAAAISNGDLLEGRVDEPAVHPGLVALGAIVALLVAASPFWIWFLGFVMRLLNKPWEGSR